MTLANRLIIPLLLALSVATPTTSKEAPDREAIARDAAWRLLRGDYSVAEPLSREGEKFQQLQGAVQQLLRLTGRPVEITSAVGSADDRALVLVEVRCQREKLSIGIRVDDAGRVGGVDLAFAPRKARPTGGISDPCVARPA
jgi:hypothetical protein